MKIIIQYFLMVVLVLLAILGVLRIGENLIAPPAIYGNWRLISDGSYPCLVQNDMVDISVLFISQSGSYLDISFGEVKGFHIRAQFIDSQVEVEEPVQLSLRLDRRNDPYQLHGVITIPGCPDSYSVSYERLPVQAVQPGGVQ